MKTLRLLVAISMLSFGPAFADNVNAQFGPYNCDPFAGGWNCDACDMTAGYQGWTWGNECGDSCVCQHYSVTVYEYLEGLGCSFICDYGHDDYCDCRAWVFDVSVGLDRKFLI